MGLDFSHSEGRLLDNAQKSLDFHKQIIEMIIAYHLIDKGCPFDEDKICVFPEKIRGIDGYCEDVFPEMEGDPIREETIWNCWKKYLPKKTKRILKRRTENSVRILPGQPWGEEKAR